jgi:hypothetical protein
MQISREDLETLRLIRAFGRIQDPETRREIIELAESKADTSADKPSDEPQYHSVDGFLGHAGLAFVSACLEGNRLQRIVFLGRQVVATDLGDELALFLLKERNLLVQS